MAAIFKRNKNDRNEPYTIQYLDHLGKRCTVKGFTDKGLSEQLAAKLEGEARIAEVDPILWTTKWGFVARGLTPSSFVRQGRSP